MQIEIPVWHAMTLRIQPHFRTGSEQSTPFRDMDGNHATIPEFWK